MLSVHTQSQVIFPHSISSVLDNKQIIKIKPDLYVAFRIVFHQLYRMQGTGNHGYMYWPCSLTMHKRDALYLYKSIHVGPKQTIVHWYLQCKKAIHLYDKIMLYIMPCKRVEHSNMKAVWHCVLIQKISNETWHSRNHGDISVSCIYV